MTHYLLLQEQPKKKRKKKNANGGVGLKWLGAREVGREWHGMVFFCCDDTSGFHMVFIGLIPPLSFLPDSVQCNLY